MKNQNPFTRFSKLFISWRLVILLAFFHSQPNVGFKTIWHIFDIFSIPGFPINKLQSRVLHLHCYDYDRFSKDDSIGEIHLPLCQVRSVLCLKNLCLDKRTSKEIVERRHGEPIKFLFLPKIGLLGSQACTGCLNSICAKTTTY